MTPTAALLSAFLSSDPQLWVRFNPAPPLRDAYYCDARVGGVVHTFLLHLHCEGVADVCRVSLEAGAPAQDRGSTILDAVSMSRQVRVTGTDLFNATLRLEGDPFLTKVQEIAVTCRLRFGPPPLSPGAGAVH